MVKNNVIYTKLHPGTLERDRQGSKVLVTPEGDFLSPVPGKWSDPTTLPKAQVLSELNDLDCPVAVHTGASNIIVLDFDD